MDTYEVEVITADSEDHYEYPTLAEALVAYGRWCDIAAGQLEPMEIGLHDLGTSTTLKTYEI